MSSLHILRILISLHILRDNYTIYFILMQFMYNTEIKLCDGKLYLQVMLPVDGLIAYKLRYIFHEAPITISVQFTYDQIKSCLNARNGEKRLERLLPGSIGIKKNYY